MPVCAPPAFRSIFVKCLVSLLIYLVGGKSHRVISALHPLPPTYPAPNGCKSSSRVRYDRRCRLFVQPATGSHHHRNRDVSLSPFGNARILRLCATTSCANATNKPPRLFAG